MAAPLSLSKATIDTPDGQLKGVSIVVRLNRATVRRGRDLVRSDEVSKVAATGRTTWLITLADGSEWIVTRDRNCGCGG